MNMATWYKKIGSFLPFGAVIAVMFVLFVLFFIHNGRGPMLGALDIAMFHVINHDLQNPMLNDLAEIAYFFGSSNKKIYIYLFLLTASVLFISIIRSSKELKRLVAVLVIALLISAIIINPLKSTYSISRPYLYLDNVSIYKGKNWLDLKEPQSDGDRRNSFPSGHATIMFTLLGALWIYKRVRVPLFMFMILASFLIIYVGSHYVSDIVAGGVIGFTVGYFFQKGMPMTEHPVNRKIP